ncbi:uncharacterized protein LOC113367677 [Ctenocephalides felis]|uniref:uncharacterized protein LOC113367677 n=1 Tax=Ctenocephalides felis TaxID=7515 RepID=UPI000E6E37EF|nr:uncharacterized protein LOC113367677 [Ctenocephalides felis]
MIQYSSERWLTFLYGLIMVCGTVCSGACAVAWNHWKFVLDTCTIDVTCGCILNARSTHRYFTGGHVSYCHWAVYGLLPSVAVALVFFMYHGYRVCINSKGKPPKSYEETVITSRSREHISMVTRVKDTASPHNAPNDDEAIHLCWPPAAAICALVFLVCLVHASMLTDGYYKSCYEYRTELGKILRASGNQVR